jgi:pyridoxal phosphate enzyme (YggS family)
MSFSELKKSIPENVTLVAVSKTKPVQAIFELYQEGQRVFGENKVQELVDKHEILPKDIQWHMIGHLQSNKVKYIASFIDMIHAVDSLKLLQEINKQARINNRTIDCLLQFHIASEETKYGLSFDEATQLLEEADFMELQNIEICGVMGMASFTKNQEQIHEEFQELEAIFQQIKSHYFKFNPNFKHISMGMSGDYQIAIEEGSTIVRIGSLLFGDRTYTHN